jgi:glycosyltransferase involved in cell wall biosynthesis
MTVTATGHVLFPCETMPDYRVEFFTLLRSALQERGIRLEVVYGDSRGDLAATRAFAPLPWGVNRRNRVLHFGGRSVIWQPCTRDALRADLVVADQASRLLLNYWLLRQQRRGRTRLGLWGHGENLNRPSASKIGEEVKRRITRLPHWWFAYTEGTRRRVEALGYPSDRITVTQNSGATASLRRLLDAVRPEREDELARELGLGAGPIGLFLGSLYPDKRLDYLVDAADEIVARMPGFRLVIAGEGPARESVAAAAAARPHVDWVGRVEGERKAALLKKAVAMLVPGAVGLTVVDAFVAGLPVVTASVDTNGPEIEYVHDGENGRVLPAAASAREFAEAALSVICDDGQLRSGADRMGRACTTERMVQRFVQGIQLALAAPPLSAKR